MRDSPVAKVHNLAYNTFTGTSVNIYRHFWQLYLSFASFSCQFLRSKRYKVGKFQGFDYGTARNLEVYGQPQPINFMDHYDKIGIVKINNGSIQNYLTILLCRYSHSFLCWLAR